MLRVRMIIDLVYVISILFEDFYWSSVACSLKPCCEGNIFKALVSMVYSVHVQCSTCD